MHPFFTEEHELFRQTVDRFVEQHCSREYVRECDMKREYPYEAYAKYAEQVRAVSETQAQAIAKKYIVPANMVVVAVGDRKAIEPALQKLNIGTIEIRDAVGRPVN